MTIGEYNELLFWIKGKTIAIVYNFEGDATGGAAKYDFWEGDVVADWVHAVYELHGMPFILDARTFIEKAMNKTLPPIDYVVNLNDGYFNLSSLSLVPSTCAYCNIPCIPCDSSTLLLGENKLLSNIVAGAYGFNLPKTLSEESDQSITRPYCLGSSCGVIKGKSKSSKIRTIIQEFIPGFDVTIPVIYCPLEEDLTVLPAVAYWPNNSDPNWFLGEYQKRDHAEYEKKVIKLDPFTEKNVREFAKYIGIQTYCRVDFRYMCKNSEEMQKAFDFGGSWNALKFIEVNPLPTIKENINFLFSLENTARTSSIAKCADNYCVNVRNATLTGFVLSASIMALIKAKH